MVKIQVGGDEVILDPEHLKFDEHNLNEYLQNFASWYSHYTVSHAHAQLVNSLYEDRYKQVYSERFKFYKAEGGSDKLAEASATADEVVVEALKKVRKSKENVQVLWGWLRSMDKAHDDALNLGYNIRKEMDKIAGNFIRGEPHIDPQAELEKILGVSENV